MSSNFVIVVFFVFSMVTSGLVGWRAGKTASNRAGFIRFRALMMTMALFFTVVPLAPVVVSTILAGGAESLSHFLDMWTAAMFIVVGGIIVGSAILWAILVLGILFCLAAVSISSRNSGNGEICSERQSSQLAQQEEFLWNVEEKSAQQKGGQ
ncbi:hypothetical protein [Ruegeria sp. HKCCD7559]|uniref:hypothetical protein n=1 Tax=Ruegeria sp. HKCCD7559 TaxID=2683005 RepID=UPI0014918433|nr:hypothetical protein [Ruegeria sp. HKCCD7559]NOC45955.1 hypothetical protein [Ruegeria sp. HKCCD7559]